MRLCSGSLSRIYGLKAEVVSSVHVQLVPWKLSVIQSSGVSAIQGLLKYWSELMEEQSGLFGIIRGCLPLRNICWNFYPPLHNKSGHRVRCRHTTEHLNQDTRLKSLLNSRAHKNGPRAHKNGPRAHKNGRLDQERVTIHNRMEFPASIKNSNMHCAGCVKC